jgi:alginate O-acetyltransferase complex protein AlgJ
VVPTRVDYGGGVASEPQQLPAVHEAWLPREHALHRPRHGGRQLTALISALLFFMTPTLLWVFGVRPGEIENHKLAGFPGIGRGWAFFTDMPTWAVDQLSFRPGAIAAADGISRGLFGEEAPLDQGPPPNAGPIPAPPPNAPPKTAPTQGTAPNAQSGYRRVVQGLDGWLYYGYDADAKCDPSRPLTETISKINELRRAVEQSGRRFELVVAPDKSTMVPQFLPASYPGKDCSRSAEASTWHRMINDAQAIDLRPELRASEGRVQRPVYPSNDTHWADEGALVMTRAIANAIKPGVTQTWVSVPVGQYDTAADLPPLINKQGMKTNTLYSLRPDGLVERAGQSNGDIDRPVYRTASPLVGTVDEKILVYGDSFTKASSRYLSGAFTNLTMLAHFTQKTSQAEAVDAFVNSNVVVVEAVERSIAGGQLAFIDEGFINAVKTALAAHPVR